MTAYTYKMVRQISKKACDTMMLAVMATLADRFKFTADDLEKLMRDVAFAVKHNGDTIDRQDLKDIIAKYTEVKV